MKKYDVFFNHSEGRGFVIPSDPSCYSSYLPYYIVGKNMNGEDAIEKLRVSEYISKNHSDLSDILVSMGFERTFKEANSFNYMVYEIYHVLISEEDEKDEEVI